MCDHLRRVLNAKSIVDTRNPRYMRSLLPRQRCCRATPACKLRIFTECPSDETIDKLAYDTEHHPADNVLKIQCSKKNKETHKTCCGQKVETCPYCQPSKDCSDSARSKSFPDKMENCCYNIKPHICQNPCPSPYLNAFPGQRRASSRSRAGSCQRKSDESRRADTQHCNDNASCNGNRISRYSREVTAAAERRVSDPCPCPGMSKNQPCPVRLAEEERRIADRCEDEARYAKFVFDITEDIVRHGYYTDEEMKQVFQRHLQENSDYLDRRKMLYEIYQLKISLNILDDSDEEDEHEANLVYAANFASQRGPKPPTPPKSLNDEKVKDKLESIKCYEDCGGEGTGKCVILVDANPEIVVTEREVLHTLMDNHVEVEQIERIHKNLFRKAKDVQVCEIKAGSTLYKCQPINEIKRGTSANEFVDAISRERVHGILRKDSKSYSAADKSSRRPSPLKARHDDVLEKCSRWKIDTCGCRPTSPCSPTITPRRTSPMPMSRRGNSPARPAMSPQVRRDPPTCTPPRSRRESPVTFASPRSQRELSCPSSQTQVTCSPRVNESPCTPASRRSGGKPFERRDTPRPPTWIPGTKNTERPMESQQFAAVIIVEKRICDSKKSDEVEDDIEEELEYDSDSREKKKDELGYAGTEELGISEEEAESQEMDPERCSTDCKDETEKNIDALLAGGDAASINEDSTSSRPDTPSNKISVDNSIEKELDEPTMSELLELGDKVKKRSRGGDSGYETQKNWTEKLSELEPGGKYCEPGCRDQDSSRCRDDCENADNGCRNLKEPTTCLHSNLNK